MTTRNTAQARLHCPVPGCNSTFGRKADLSRHDAEKHGDMKYCSQPGCKYPGTKRAARLKEHMENKHPDLYNVPIHVPTSSQSGSQYSHADDQTQVNEPRATTFTCGPANASSYTPVSPTQSSSSATSSSWSPSVYASNPAVPIYQQPPQWQPMQPYQAQQYSTVPLSYYPQAAYDGGFSTFSPAGSNTFDDAPAYTPDDTSAQDHNENESGGGQHYPY